MERDGEQRERGKRGERDKRPERSRRGKEPSLIMGWVTCSGGVGESLAVAR